MKARAIWKSCEAIILALLALGLMTLVAFAGVGTPIPSGSTVTIDAFSICRKITNPDNGTRMVFTSTQAEWQSFIDHPNGLALKACALHCNHWKSKKSCNGNVISEQIGTSTRTSNCQKFCEKKGASCCTYMKQGTKGSIHMCRAWTGSQTSGSARYQGTICD